MKERPVAVGLATHFLQETMHCVNDVFSIIYRGVTRVLQGSLPLFPFLDSKLRCWIGSILGSWSPHGSAIMEQERLMEARLKWCNDTLPSRS